jgi:hypothetical protein
MSEDAEWRTEERERTAAELTAEEGANWIERNRPGSFGCHELLDRTSINVDMIESHLVEHSACIANPEWYELAWKAADSLHDLYQKIGAVHLSVEKETGD